MNTLLGFLLWVWLIVAPLWCVILLLSVPGALPGRHPLRQALPFTYTGSRGAPQVFFGVLGSRPIQAMSWPLDLISSGVGTIKVIRQIGLEASAEVARDALYRDALSRHKTWSPLWQAVLVALALLALSLYPPAAGIALTGLLAGLWGSMLLWLLSLSLPGQHLARAARAHPRGLALFIPGFFLLFALLFPATGSALVSLRTGQLPTLASLWKGVADTYLLGGVLFEGPKAALPLLRDQAASAVAIATGLSLYALIASAALQGLFRRITTEDRLNMAAAKLLVGDFEGAQSILDVDASDDTALWDLRAITLALGGQVEAAVEVVSSKVPEVSGLMSTPSISATGYLLVRLKDWSVRPTVRDELWVRLAGQAPREDDLMALWLLANPMPNAGPVPELIVKLGDISGFKALPWFAAMLRTVSARSLSAAEQRMDEAKALVITSPCVMALKAALLACLQSRMQQPGAKDAIDDALVHMRQGVSVASAPSHYLVLLPALLLIGDLSRRTRHAAAAEFESLRQRAFERVRLLPAGAAVGALMAQLHVQS